LKDRPKVSLKAPNLTLQTKSQNVLEVQLHTHRSQLLSWSIEGFLEDAAVGYFGSFRNIFCDPSEMLQFGQ
jgi:hypothetical protein